ncbi:MAG TPA: amylo-alpha-1,6-glucosidase [Candidatus Limnocylindria bacterium]|nr:amylo-alpha-1,6-glucosidase [Candidatus Limnocylindria bacterium]
MLTVSRDVIRHEDEFYILASSSRVDDRTRVLKHGDTFAVYDRFGDLAPVGLGELGIYHEGTRFLSRLGLTIANHRPLLLSSTVTEDNARMVVDLTNPDYRVGSMADVQAVIARGTVHVARETLLWRGVGYERLTIINYGSGRVSIPIRLDVDADFADIFEVRGTRREATGARLPPVVEDGELLLGYLGRDERERRLRLRCTPRPTRVESDALHFEIDLAPKERAVYVLTFGFEIGQARPHVQVYDDAVREAQRDREASGTFDCHARTSNEQFNEWLNRSLADLHMMTTDTPQGPYPYAGVPWFSAPFGRDGIITALQLLWVNPATARGVLAYLAANQARESNPDQDAEPGKILHEARDGEMAALHEIPFGRYYGSVDATPLFVLLAGAYEERTGDRELIDAIWPNIERALDWIEQRGDADGDGFVEYTRHSSQGLLHQGWKDSHDAIFHADGTAVEGSVALCEVQGYVYAAKRQAARLLRARGDERRADKLDHQARGLRRRFDEAFWCEELGTYALALDGAKRPCRVRTSNPGHCLFTGIASRRRARRVADTLLGEDSLTGWGIRTVAAGEARYNPMSYHNGSVWPHDNALIASGFARYGFRDATLRILTGLFDASLFVDLHRLPELFCGFPRRPAEGPTLYPVACAPQSWAAGAVFMLLEACLGLSIQAAHRRICFRRPMLPESLETVWLRNLHVGDAIADVCLHRHGQDVGLTVLNRTGRVEIVMVK